MTRRPTLPEYIAAVHPDGPPPNLMPVRLVPVDVFFDEECDQCQTPIGYGLMDAVPGHSDCNRAEGRIYRRDEDWSPRDPGDVIVVWVAPEEAAKFERVLGDSGAAGARRLVTEKFLREVAGRNAIEELGLDGRAYNPLRTAGVRHLCDLLKLTEDDLYAMRNMGVKSVENIKERLLAEYGLMLADGSCTSTSA